MSIYPILLHHTLDLDYSCLFIIYRYIYHYRTCKIYIGHILIHVHLRIVTTVSRSKTKLRSTSLGRQGYFSQGTVGLGILEFN
jgi:hypothetical protein